MKNKKDVYDERQMIERNNAFKYGAAVALIMLLIGAVLNSMFGEAVGADLRHYVSFGIKLIFWTSFSTIIIAMILKDAFDGVDDSVGMILFSLWGLAALIIIIVNIVEIVINQPTFQMLLKDDWTFANIFMSLCWITMCTVYWVKHLVNRKKEKKEQP